MCVLWRAKYMRSYYGKDRALQAPELASPNFEAPLNTNFKPDIWDITHLRLTFCDGSFRWLAVREVKPVACVSIRGSFSQLRVFYGTGR